MNKSTILVIEQKEPKNVSSNISKSFEELKIWERSHIQEWIRKSPTILGEELLILSIEFDKFQQSSDRLDILAMDKKGNLVVVELKRDSFAGYADLQAIRYAAMVSSMTINKILPYYLAYHNKNNPENLIDIKVANEQILEFSEESFTDFSVKPRIILCSENFSQELTTSVLWLVNQFGVNITCVRIKPHIIGENIIIIPTVIIPIPEAKQYQIDIQQKEEAISIEKNNRTKRPTTLKVLLESDKLKKGDIIYLKSEIPAYLRPYFDNSSKPENYFQAEITGKLGKTNAVKWLFDQNEYSISNLTSNIFIEIHPEKTHPGPIAGGSYWVTSEGKNLYNWADEVWNEKTNAI